MTKNSVKKIFSDIFPSYQKNSLKKTKKDLINCVLFYTFAFLIPFTIIIFCAVTRELAPFGENTLIAIDAWGQYFPMLRELESALGEFNLSYSFSGALGFNLTAQSAYYTNSPFWLLMFLIPGELTPSQVDMTVFIRFGLASLTCAYYLRHHFPEKSRGAIAFSTAYALSGYTLAFINQFMWMDAVIFLPLVLLGIEKLYEGKGILLYTVSLFLTIWANFYIAYSVCLFSVLWFFMQTVNYPVKFKEWFYKALRFGICSLAAGIANLPVLIPLLKAVSNTLASSMGFGTVFRFYHSTMDLLKMLLPLRKSSLAFEAPNIYFGIVPLALCVFAVISKIPVRKKLSAAALFVFMLLSFNFNLLDFIWHGFHFPNQLPGRQSFLFIFLGIVIAFRGYISVISESKTNKKVLKKICAILICFVICAEIGYNTLYKIMGDTRCVPVSSVLRNETAMTEITENFTPDKSENEFWRIESTSPRYNGGQLWGYSGISHYSSTMSGDCYNFFTSLGMSVYAKNVSIEYLQNPVLNALFSVKYILSDTCSPDSTQFFAGKCDNTYVLENKYVLPLFFVAEKDVLNVDMTLKGHALTNDIFKKAAGTSDVILGTGVINEDTSEQYLFDLEEFKKGIDNILENNTEITDFGKTKIKGTVNSLKDGILIISLPAKDVTVKIDGKKCETLTVAGYLAGAGISKGEHTVEILLN